MRPWKLALLAAALGSQHAAAQKELQSTNTARDGKFVILQLFVDNDQRFQQQWAQPTPPNLTTTNSVVRNQTFFQKIIIGGCDPDKQQKCDVVGNIKITDPRGKTYGEYKDVPIFREKAGDAVLMLSPVSMGITVEDGEALGRYKLEIIATDRKAAKTLRVFDYVEVSEAPALK